MLVRHDDAGIACGASVSGRERPAGGEYAPGGRRERADYDLHQGRLACAVLSDDRAHLGRTQLEVHPVDGEHIVRREANRDRTNLEERIGGGHSRGMSRKTSPLSIFSIMRAICARTASST